jgi:hypothetical protein
MDESWLKKILNSTDHLGREGDALPTLSSQLQIQIKKLFQSYQLFFKNIFYLEIY